MHGIVVGHFFSNMDVILERYQRYSFEERAVVDQNIGGQVNDALNCCVIIYACAVTLLIVV
jgi:hypothetical protein